jgi:hypothetical protein
MKKRKQSRDTRKVVDGRVRRAYGLFKKKVVVNVPWSVTALQNILSGDHRALSGALKYHVSAGHGRCLQDAMPIPPAD